MVQRSRHVLKRTHVRPPATPGAVQARRCRCRRQLAARLAAVCVCYGRQNPDSRAWTHTPRTSRFCAATPAVRGRAGGRDAPQPAQVDVLRQGGQVVHTSAHGLGTWSGISSQHGKGQGADRVRVHLLHLRRAIQLSSCMLNNMASKIQFRPSPVMNQMSRHESIEFLLRL